MRATGALRRLLALVLVAAVGWTPRVVHATPEAGVGDPVFDEASALYDQGKGKFETADYVAAVELWTRAYTLLPATPKYAKIKVLLLYDLATARERAFEVDNRASHLRQARILLENFEASIPNIYGEGHEATRERERVHERLAGLDAALAEVGEEAPEPGPTGADPATPTPIVVVDDAKPPDDDGRRKKQLVAGGVMLGVGVASFGLMVGGFVMGKDANDISELDPDDVEGRREQFDRGRAGNVLAAVGGVLGGALVLTGAVLMGTASLPSKRDARLLPVAGPGFAGLSASGRF